MDAPGVPAEHALLILEAPFTDPPAHVLTVRGVIGIEDEEELTGAFARATASGDPIIIDLAALSHDDELLLGLLLTAQRACRLILVGPLPPLFVQRLDRTCTHDLFSVQPSLTRALADLTS